jgi:predicted metal-dependent hydrolase
MRHATLAGDPPVEIMLRRSARARRISLRVSALDGRVTLSVPKRVPEAEALAFAEEKSDWIRRHLAKHAAHETVGFGSTLPIEGKMVTVTRGDTKRAVLEGDTLRVPQGEAMVGARVQAYLKLRARARLSERAAHYAALLDRSVGRITLRDTRSRWGSCASSGNLMFSWRLIMAPPEVLDYVAAHEAAHLVEMNHAPAYWANVARIFPGYEAQRRWLREHGTALHRYRFGD